MTLGSQIIFQWKRRDKKVENKYSISGWALSVMPALWEDVVERMNGVHCGDLERVVTKLH